MLYPSIGMLLLSAHSLLSKSFRTPLPRSLLRLSSSLPYSPRTTISYFTDVEGDLNYLNRYVDLSSVISRPDPTDPSELTLLPNSHVVFGGDSVDRGGFDIMTLTLLARFKKKYPSNVHFIMGNRDCNKLRIRSELGAPTQPTPPPHSGVYWLPPHTPPTSNVSRLQWLLKSTMGCPDSFIFRKNELCILNETDDITGEDVVESFRQTCSPGGLMANHIMAAVPSIKFGPVLFVHAGIPSPDGNKGRGTIKSPNDYSFNSYPPAFNPTSGFSDWLAKTSAFVEVQKQDWLNSSGKDDIWAERGGYSDEPDAGGSLMQCE